MGVQVEPEYARRTIERLIASGVISEAPLEFVDRIGNFQSSCRLDG